jgi:DNA-binding MarR family transcriptional regulator
MAAEPLHDERLTTVGLFFEAHAGLARELGRRMERDAGVSVQWFEVLLRLARTPGNQLRMSDLAAQTTLTASGLTRAVDRLEEAGLVSRRVCPSDRRGFNAVLTPAGRRCIEKAVPVHLAHVEELLDAALSPAEQDELGALLRKLRDALNPGAARASTCDEQTTT